jgi:hypothetical protein
VLTPACFSSSHLPRLPASAKKLILLISFSWAPGKGENFFSAVLMPKREGARTLKKD